MKAAILSDILPPSLAVGLGDADRRADTVAAYRRYADGDHPANLTQEMRELLRITDAESVSQRFNDNYMDIVITTIADRCILRTVEADNDVGTKWAQEVLTVNRIDGLQGEVTEAAFRDADTFVMVSFDNEKDQVVFTHEQAFDGEEGIVPIYRNKGDMLPEVVAKLWTEWIDGFDKDGKPQAEQTIRANLYYDDRMERYVWRESGVQAYSTDTVPSVVNWTFEDGVPIGVPFIHFRNRGRKQFGISELKQAIPLQNALNRTLYSTVMASEYTGFGIFKAIGFDPPKALRPGSVVIIGAEGLTTSQVADFDKLDGADMSQYLSTLQYFAGEIGRVTRTAAPELSAGAGASGESLKERANGLIGKAKRFMVKAGNGWEDVLTMAHRVADAFAAAKPPMVSRFYAVWSDPELRNDTETIQNALQVRDDVGSRQFLRMVGDVFDLDEEAIDQIIIERENEAEAQVQRAAASIPTFTNFGDQAGATQP